MREHTKGSKHEGAYKKRKVILLEQSDHTKTFLPARRSQTTVISKRDVGHQEAPYCSKWKQSTKRSEHNKMAEHGETATSDNELQTITTQRTLNEENQRETTNHKKLAGKQEEAKKKQKATLAALKQRMRKGQL